MTDLRLHITIVCYELKQKLIVFLYWPKSANSVRVSTPLGLQLTITSITPTLYLELLLPLETPSNIIPTYTVVQLQPLQQAWKARTTQLAKINEDIKTPVASSLGMPTADDNEVVNKSLEWLQSDIGVIDLVNPYLRVTFNPACTEWLTQSRRDYKQKSKECLPKWLSRPSTGSKLARTR